MSNAADHVEKRTLRTYMVGWELGAVEISQPARMWQDVGEKESPPARLNPRRIDVSEMSRLSDDLIR